MSALSRNDFTHGLELLADLYRHLPTLPMGSDAQEIHLHRYGRMAIERAEQIRLAVAVIDEMDKPEIRLRLNRGLPSAWVDVRGHLVGLSLTVTMFADDVCDRRPEARLKRDRWVMPPEIVAAVEGAAAEA